LREVPRIGVLNNLRAGRQGSRVDDVLELLRGYPEVAHEETDSAALLPAAIARLARRDLDLLVVNGGDGTLQHALTEILERRAFSRLPLIAPLRGGRTNMTALDLGAHWDPVKGLHGLIEDARAGRIGARVVERPVLRVELDRGRHVEHGMFFGVGMIRRAIALTHDLFPAGASQGGFGAGLVTMALVARAAFRPREGVLQPDKIQIRLDGESVPAGEFYLAIATSLTRLFWRIDPFWGPGSGPVRFTAIASNARRLLASAPGILWGRAGRFVRPENGYTSQRVDRAQLLFDSGFTIDGEIFEGRSDEVVTLGGDRRLTFLRA
jgi:diacylglycerol kinase family enzyme